MPHAPQPSAYRQVATFHRELYDELVSLGHSPTDIFKLSLSKALVKRYGSGEAVDEELGEGTFKGVKAVYGELASWRKAWRNVLKEHKVRIQNRLKALWHLRVAVGECMEAEVTEADIIAAVEKTLNGASPATALNVQPNEVHSNPAYSSCA